MNRKKFIFIFIFVLIVFIFFLLVEISLRLFNYGINTEILRIEKSIKEKFKEEYLTLNGEYVNKYYPGAKNDRTSEKKVFIKKDKDLKLGFVIGGSSAQGYPYEPNTSFSKITERILSLSSEFKNTHIVNVATSAMSSFYVYDVAKKILKYKPEFIIIYSGHNEYYGTLGHFSRGNFFSKHLYLFLKEFKIVQFLLNIFEYKKIDVNLMEQLYDNKKIYDEKIDREVTRDFIKNIEKIVKLYSKKNIPVIIINPVSNVIDFPPFYQEEEYKDFVINYYNDLQNGKMKDMDRINKKIEENKESAILYYLRGLTRIKNGEKNGIDDLIFAKDIDKIPFRAKSILNNELRVYYENSKDRYKNLYFIDLYEEIKKDNVNLLGNDIFCDHLHFNYKGNKLVSHYLVKKISDIYKLNEISVTDESIDQLVYKTDLNDLIAYFRLSSLTENKPYSEMYLKYKLFDISNNMFYKNTDLYDLIDSVSYSIDEIYRIAVNYYINKEDKENIIKLFNSYSLSYCGSEVAFLFLAQKLRLENNLDLANYYYVIAYLLSKREPILYNKIREYFVIKAKYEGKNIDFYINDFLKKYGNPKKYIKSPVEILKKIKKLDEEKNYEMIKTLIYNIKFFSYGDKGNIERLNSQDKIVEGIKNRVSSGNFSYSPDTIDYHIKNINRFLKKANSKTIKKYMGLFNLDNYLDLYVNKYPARVLIYDNPKTKTLLIFVSLENGVFLVYTNNLAAKP